MAESKQYNLIIPILLFFFSINGYTQNIDTAYNDPDNIDVKLFRLVNNSRTESLDRIVRITDFSVLPVSIITPVALFTVSRINNDTYDENSSVLLSLSEITSAGTTLLIKNIVKRKRPFQQLKNVNHSSEDERLLDHHSFPSGHTSMVFSYATSLALRYPDKPYLIAGLYSYAMIVSLGRMYLGNHYPSDILGGMLIGSGSAILIYSLRSEIISFKNNIFREKDKPDENNSELLTPLFFGSIIISDIVNQFFHDSSDKLRINLFSTGEMNYINLKCNF